MTYTPTLGAFAKPVSPLALDSFAGALSRARANDPRSEIVDFGQRLLKAFDERAAARSPLLDALLEVVGPIRIYGIARNLRDLRVDEEALQGFLEHTWNVSTVRLAAATTPDELAEALADALDDLHVYVLAHDLVIERSYLEVELAIAKRLGEPDHDPQPEVEEPQRHAEPAAAENNLALAA